MSALYEIRPYLSAHRIHRTDAPPGARHVEQHADKAIAEARLAILNRQAPKPKARPAVPSPAKVDAPTKSAELPLDVAPAADLSVLDQSLGAIATALGSGAHDAHLGELLEAEQNGKTRKGAIAMLESRIAEVG